MNYGLGQPRILVSLIVPPRHRLVLIASPSVARHHGADAGAQLLHVFDLFEQRPYRSVHAYDIDEYSALFNSWTTEMDALARGAKSRDDVIAALYKLLSESTVVPGPWKLSDATNRCPGELTLRGALRMFAWGKMAAPDSIKRNYFHTLPGLRTFSALRKTHRELVKKDANATRAMVRDGFRAWNEDFLQR